MSLHRAPPMSLRCTLATGVAERHEGIRTTVRNLLRLRRPGCQQPGLPPIAPNSHPIRVAYYVTPKFITIPGLQTRIDSQFPRR
jgi:hypothetical protein